MIHRRISGDDFYFVASGVADERFSMYFRPSGKGKRPELWWPDSGHIEPISVFNEHVTPIGAIPAAQVNVSRVSIPISFDPYGSVFVVFRSEDQSPRTTLFLFNTMAPQCLVSSPVFEYQFNSADVKQTDDRQLMIARDRW